MNFYYYLKNKNNLFNKAILISLIFLFFSTQFAFAAENYAYVPTELRSDVLKAFISGILTGKNDGYIDASGDATRAEACTILLRAMDEL